MTAETAPINDDFALALNNDWRIGADSLQWMLQKRVVTGGKTVWVSQHFIAQHKSGLMRAIKRYGFEVSPEGMAAFDALPDTFREFHAVYNTRSGRGRKKVNAA
jgi:hypothetical protein